MNFDNLSDALATPYRPKAQHKPRPIPDPNQAKEDANELDDPNPMELDERHIDVKLDSARLPRFRQLDPHAWFRFKSEYLITRFRNNTPLLHCLSDEILSIISIHFRGQFDLYDNEALLQAIDSLFQFSSYSEYTAYLRNIRLNPRDEFSIQAILAYNAAFMSAFQRCPEHLRPNEPKSIAANYANGLFPHELREVIYSRVFVNLEDLFTFTFETARRDFSHFASCHRRSRDNNHNPITTRTTTTHSSNHYNNYNTQNNQITPRTNTNHSSNNYNHYNNNNNNNNN